MLKALQVLGAIFLGLISRGKITLCGAGGATIGATILTVRSGGGDRGGGRRGRRSTTKTRRIIGDSSGTTGESGRAIGATTATSGRYFSIVNVSKAVLYLSDLSAVRKRYGHVVKWNIKIMGYY